MDGTYANRRRIVSNLVTVCKQPAHSLLNNRQEKLIDFCLLNTTEISQKEGFDRQRFAVDKNLNIVALTETWLRSGHEDDQLIGDLCPSGYNFLHVPRLNRPGSGVGLLFNNSLKFHKKQGFEFTSFQYLDSFLADQPCVRILVVYRPPPSEMNGFSASLFYDEFSSLLEQLVVSPENFVIVGDFNFHVDDHSDIQARRFLALLDNFDLKQLVSQSTHERGHTLDFIITRSDDADFLCGMFIRSMFRFPIIHPFCSSWIILSLPGRSP